MGWCMLARKYRKCCGPTSRETALEYVERFGLDEQARNWLSCLAWAASWLIFWAG